MAKKIDEINTLPTESTDAVLRTESTESEAIEENGAPAVVASDPSEAPRKSKKMQKDVVYDGANSAVKITIAGGDLGEMVFPLSDLPEDIVGKLAPFGLGHKLGDAAAGTSGVEAEAAIQKVWEGLKSSDWTIRQPAAPKLDRKAVLERVANLDPAQQEAAKALLASLGINL